MIYKAKVLFLKMFFISHLGMMKALIVQRSESFTYSVVTSRIVYVIRVIDYRLLQIFTPLKTSMFPKKGLFQ